MGLSACVPGVLYEEDHTATVPTLHKTLSPSSLERARGGEYTFVVRTAVGVHNQAVCGVGRMEALQLLRGLEGWHVRMVAL